MANLREISVWEVGIYQLETSDPVMGGENGIDNRVPRQLANRTLWLKNELARQIGLVNQNNTNLNNQKADKTVQFTAGAGLTGGGDLSASRSLSLGTPSKITANSTNTAASNTHSHEIDKANTTTAGIVQLVDNLTSNANNQALTAKQGKVLNDTKLGNTGTQTLNGTLKITSNQWGKFNLPLQDGTQWWMEANPSYKSAQNGGLGIRFMHDDQGIKTFYDLNKSNKSEIIAYQSWVQDSFLAKTANAASATKLHTPRQIALTGAVTGSVNFDGSGNVSLATTLNLADFANSKNENGYQRLPNGLILQWGITLSIRDEQELVTSFPITFPTACLSVHLTEKQKSSYHSAAGHVAVINLTTKNFTAWFNSTQSVSTSCYWFAIGY